MSEQKAIPISIYRCGTSKGIFIEKKHMPKDQSAKTKVLLDLLGNPDSSQIDGIGGGNILTSKVGIISKSSKKNIDLEYEFAQIQIGKNFVD